MSAEPKRRGNPSWRKGMPSPNPTGRPKGAARIAEEVYKRTNGGVEILETLLGLMREKATSIGGRRVRLDACRELLNRLVGKPLQVVDLGGGHADAMDAALESLSDDELDEFLAVAERLHLVPAQDEGSD